MIRFNAGDKQTLNSLKGHANIKFAIEKVSNVADKLFILVQVSRKSVLKIRLPSKDRFIFTLYLLSVSWETYLCSTWEIASWSWKRQMS